MLGATRDGLQRLRLVILENAGTMHSDLILI